MDWRYLDREKWHFHDPIYLSHSTQLNLTQLRMNGPYDFSVSPNFFLWLPKDKTYYRVQGMYISLTKFMIKERCDWRDKGCTDGWRLIFGRFSPNKSCLRDMRRIKKKFSPKRLWNQVSVLRIIKYVITKQNSSNLRQSDEPVPNINCRVIKILLQEGLYKKQSLI